MYSMNKKIEIQNKVIKAATYEFLSKGFQAASMENISTIAQISKRTLYKYYGSKETLLNQLIEELLEKCAIDRVPPYNKEQDISTQIEEIICAKIELLTSKKYTQISKILMTELFKGKKLTTEQLQQFTDSSNQFLSWINQAKEDGKITKLIPSEVIVTQFHSIIKGQIFYPVILGFTQIDESLVEQVKISAKNFFLNTFIKVEK